MWSFLIVDDNLADALPIKYCIFQLFSVAGPSLDTIQKHLIQIGNGTDLTELDSLFSDIECLHEKNIYKKEGAFQLKIINSKLSETNDADHLINIEKALQESEYPFHLTYINSEYYNRVNKQVLLPIALSQFQQVFDLLPDSHVFYYSKKFNEYPTYHLWERLQRQNNGKITLLINPDGNETWFNEAFYRIQAESRKILYDRSVTLYRSQANNIELIKGYTNALDQVKAEVEKGSFNINKTAWNVRDFVVGALTEFQEEVGQDKITDIIVENYLIPDLSLAFSKAFSVWAIKDLTHIPRNTYFSDTPSKVKAQAKSQLSQLNAAIHHCRHIFDHTYIREMVDHFESVLYDYFENSDPYLSKRVNFLKKLRKDFFQSRGDQISGNGLYDSIIRRKKSTIDKPLIAFKEVNKNEGGGISNPLDTELIQTINYDEIAIPEVGLEQIAQQNGISLNAFSDEFVHELESIELHFPIVDYFAADFHSFFNSINIYSEVQEVECLFQRKCLKKNVHSASGHPIDLHRNIILFRSKGKPFKKSKVANTTQIFNTFENIEYFGNYTCALKLKKHWHFYHCFAGQLVEISRDKFIDSSTLSIDHLFDETSGFNKYFCLTFKTFMPQDN